MKLPLLEVAVVEVQVVEEAEVGEEMEASLLPEAKMNLEWKEGQEEEVGEVGVVAGRAKAGEEELLHQTDGTKPNNLNRLRRRMVAAKALVSQPLAASGAFCHVVSLAGEGEEPGGDRMVVEVAPQG